MVKQTSNLDDVARMINEAHPKMKLKDIKAVLLSGTDVMIDLLSSGVGVKLHKMIKLEPVIQKGHRSYDGLNKIYYERPDKTYIKLYTLSALERALREKEGN